MKRFISGLNTSILGYPAYYLDSVGSTNVWLKEKGSTLPNGTLCWTPLQTAGRGRLGREWCSSYGKSISMSLLFKPSHNLSLLPLVCGIAVSRALTSLTKKSFQIKWPNDIVCDGYKICGILCENSFSQHGSFAVAGIGINLLQTLKDFENAGVPHAGSVKMVTGRILDMETAIAAVINNLEPLWLTLRNDGFSALYNEYESRCLTVGREVRVLSPDGNILRHGHAVGISPDGCLLVESGNGPEPVNAGEVSVRGVDGYV